MTVDRAAYRDELRRRLPDLPDDVAGYVYPEGTAELLSPPREHGYRSHTVLSWLEEDGGQRPTQQQMDAIAIAVNAAPALLDLLDAAEAALERVRDHDSATHDEMLAEERIGERCVSCFSAGIAEVALAELRARQTATPGATS